MPRPDRGDAIMEIMDNFGLTLARRSLNETPNKHTDIFLGDTIGEMGLYLLCCFCYKSLKGSCGQNPLEPAMTDTAIISGPNVDNFRETYEMLSKANAVLMVKDEAMLAAGVKLLLTNLVERKSWSVLREVVENIWSLKETNDILDTYLFPLTIKRELELIS